MAALSDVREALQARLKTIPGLRASDVGIATPTPPQASVNLRSFTYAQDYDDSVLWVFDVWIYVNSADIERGQRALDAYLAPSGEQSVKVALEDDQHLGGLSDWVRVVGALQGPSQPEISGMKVLTIALQVEVMA